MILETLESWWNSLIDLSEMFIIPDWGALVGLLPILLLIGVVGPILTIVVLFWVRYLVKRPGIKREFAEVRRPAPLDADGRPVFPVGEPYSLSEAMIYEPGAIRSDAGDPLLGWRRRRFSGPCEAANRQGIGRPHLDVMSRRREMLAQALERQLDAAACRHIARADVNQPGHPRSRLRADAARTPTTREPPHDIAPARPHADRQRSPLPARAPR